MKKTRLAIIGLGMAVKPHALSLRDLKDEAEVAAVFSPSSARREAFAAERGFPVCADAEAIFTDATIDAVMLLTPPNTHLDLVRRAARAGKHILLEKPLEISLARAEELVSAAEDAEVKLAIVLQHRFRPVSVALAELMRDGRLGTLVSVSAKLSNWRPQSYYDQPGRGTRARDGGGVLLTQGIHTLDNYLHIVGVPAELFAFANTSLAHRMECEDTVAASLRYANGATASLNATIAAYPGFSERIDCSGTRGTATLMGGQLDVHWLDGRTQTVGVAQMLGGGADPMAFTHHAHMAVIEDFLDAIENDRDPRIDGASVLPVQRFIDALLESAATRQVVRFSA